MGKFVNPDNKAFQVALNSEIYVDKTGLIEYTNRVLDTNQAWICNSRPRRFGKSITANMLVAYYSRGCDSKVMFENKIIGKSKDFETHLNKYDVIRLDIQWFMSPSQSNSDIVRRIEDSVITELKEYYPKMFDDNSLSLAEVLSSINEATGRKFVIIIDEWDVLIREEAKAHKIQTEYIEFLRTLFKGSHPTEYIHLAYLTGILPIKKAKTQSALNNFEEFTMLESDMFSAYIGFTEDEVKDLCTRYNRNFEDVKRWYDGYVLGDYHVYNPKAVVSVMERGAYRSYWSKTGSYQSILPLINMDFDGLKTAIIQMLSGDYVKVNVNDFQNDMISFACKDDVITLLIHLGYLAYDVFKGAYIPNEEIRQEFLAATRQNQWNDLLEFQKESKRLLDATWNLDAEEVAQSIEKIHMQFASSIQYNDENSLSSVLTIAYLSAMQYYFMPIREFPTGRGFADFVYIPKPEYKDTVPAMIVELKWNNRAATAIEQIKNRQYVHSVEKYTGDILLVGISYDKKTKVHECIIEEHTK